ncbi:hypothetical protein FRB95_013892 [Tulasnella sp. JGI-2019a]|nr:hypothetical protein FRB95_013892 [Tulasnella sp. JGI-2019a]
MTPEWSNADDASIVSRTLRAALSGLRFTKRSSSDKENNDPFSSSKATKVKKELRSTHRQKTSVVESQTCEQPAVEENEPQSFLQNPQPSVRVNTPATPSRIPGFVVLGSRPIYKVKSNTMGTAGDPGIGIVRQLFPIAQTQPSSNSKPIFDTISSPIAITSKLEELGLSYLNNPTTYLHYSCSPPTTPPTPHSPPSPVSTTIQEMRPEGTKPYPERTFSDPTMNFDATGAGMSNLALSKVAPIFGVASGHGMSWPSSEASAAERRSEVAVASALKPRSDSVSSQPIQLRNRKVSGPQAVSETRTHQLQSYSLQNGSSLVTTIGEKCSDGVTASKLILCQITSPVILKSPSDTLSRQRNRLTNEHAGKRKEVEVPLSIPSDSYFGQSSGRSSRQSRLSKASRKNPWAELLPDSPFKPMDGLSLKKLCVGSRQHAGDSERQTFAGSSSSQPRYSSRGSTRKLSGDGMHKRFWEKKLRLAELDIMLGDRQHRSLDITEIMLKANTANRSYINTHHQNNSPVRPGITTKRYRSDTIFPPTTTSYSRDHARAGADTRPHIPVTTTSDPCVVFPYYDRVLAKFTQPLPDSQPQVIFDPGNNPAIIHHPSALARGVKRMFRTVTGTRYEPVTTSCIRVLHRY